MTDDRRDQIPQAPDSERAVLGGLLLNQSVPPATRERLTPAQIFLDSNRKIYEAMLGLDARGVILDPVQIAEELRSRGQLEEVGGLAYVSLLTDYAVRSEIEPHTDRVIEAASKRKLWVAASRAAEAANNGIGLNQILTSLRGAISEIEQAGEIGETDHTSLAVSWSDFYAEQFAQGEQIAFAVERGEIALINSLPNAGKTTLALNVAVSLAAGRSFSPVVIEAKERRVLYVDGETRRARLQRDLRRMTKDFSREEAIAVGQNLHVVCEAEIGGESLALTRTDHLLAISVDALRVKPDFIVIDTLSSLCPVFNENDNAEQQRKVWRPLQKLARDCDAAILVLHHVGKRSEDSQTPERVYRGRGASASGGAARAVWLLIPDPVTPGLSTLSCVKAKCEPPKEARLQLDAQSRWITFLQIEPQPVITPLERVLTVVNREMRTAEIKVALKPTYQDRAIEEALAEALQINKLRLIKRGIYAPVAETAQTAQTAQTANGPFAESAESAETDNFEAENREPHYPHSPIVSADSAETITANGHNELDQKPQKAKKTAVRKLSAPKNGAGKPHYPHSPMITAESAEVEREVIEL
jgi:replicative DNA helicase